MNNNPKITSTSYGTSRDILTFTEPIASKSVTVNSIGVVPDNDGQYRIYAGQALQFPVNARTDRQVVGSVCIDELLPNYEVVGVTQHDIVFTDVDRTENACCIVFGFVDTAKMDPYAYISQFVRDQLDGRVWYVAGAASEYIPPEPPGDELLLASLTLSGIGLVPAFDPEITDYTAGTVLGMHSWTATAQNPEATVEGALNQIVWPENEQRQFGAGINRVWITVRHPEMGSRMYSITVIYTPPSGRLTDWQIANVLWRPPFSADVQDYLGTATESWFTMTAQAESPTAQVKLLVDDPELGDYREVMPGARTDFPVQGTNYLRVAVINGGIETVYQNFVQWDGYPELRREVNTYDELVEAIAEDSVTHIDIESDFELTQTITVNRRVIISGSGRVLWYNGLAQDGFIITANEVQINGLAIQMRDNGTGWEGNYAIQVYRASYVTLRDIVFAGEDAGLLVNGAEVMLGGKIVFTNDEFGGVEVSGQYQEDDIDPENPWTFARLTLLPDCDIQMQNEQPHRPAIWTIDEQFEGLELFEWPDMSIPEPIPAGTGNNVVDEDGRLYRAYAYWLDENPEKGRFMYYYTDAENVPLPPWG